MPDSARVNRTPVKVPFIVAAIVALITLGITLAGLSPDLTDAMRSSAGFSDENEFDSGRQFDRERVDADQLASARRVARARFYDTQVIPLINDVDSQNRAAADRCLEKIDRIVDGYHRGVEYFVDDMTSVSTRLGVLKRMPGGWWASDGRVETYVQQKFETHLFSEQKLVDDLSGALLGFRQDVNANQRMMLTRVQAALSTADLPGVELEQREDFFRELSTQLGSYAAEQGTTSVENMLGAFVLGEVGAFAARSVVGGLLVRFAPSVAVASAAGASATVGASATGAGGGSLGGPVGAVVGFGAGLAIGLVIDWWMTERFEAELSGQLHAYLDDLRAALVSGENTDSESTTIRKGDNVVAQQSGLNEMLPRLCDQLRDAYRDRFFEQIVDGESS